MGNFVAQFRFSPTTKISPILSFQLRGRGICTQWITFVGPYSADTFPYITDDNPYITDDKPFFADDKPYIADIAAA